MTPKLWACCNIFQEADHIERTLRAANQWVDGFIVLDGAYKQFPEAGDGSSTDGTLEIVQHFRDTAAQGKPFILQSGAWENQITKRNTYLDLVPVDDWILIVDGDFQVTFYGDGFKEYKENLVRQEWDGFLCRVVTQNLGPLIDFQWGNPLLFRKVEGLHYKYNHYSLYDGAGKFFYFPPYQMKRLELVILEAPRPPVHTERIRSYQVNHQSERANGYEPLYCPDCKIAVKLNEGDPLLCPTCKKGSLCNLPMNEGTA